MELLKLLRSLLTTRLDRVLHLYCCLDRESNANTSQVFMKIFQQKSSRVAPEPDSESSSAKIAQTSAVQGSPQRRSLAASRTVRGLASGDDTLGETLGENELDWDIRKIDGILCDLMMYQSIQISSTALQVLVMLHEQASQFVEEMAHSQLLSDEESWRFQSMTKDANYVSVALESFELWHKHEDKARATNQRLLEAIRNLNLQNSEDTTHVLRRGLCRLGLVQRIVHEVRFAQQRER